MVYAKYQDNVYVIYIWEINIWEIIKEIILNYIPYFIQFYYLVYKYRIRKTVFRNIENIVFNLYYFIK
jgi:hypothetical protein